MITWEQYYMGFALHAATKSKDSTQVGAILVEPEGAVILTAFNGPPKGVRDTPERLVKDKWKYASHAEQNLIDFAARLGIRTKDCTVYCTHLPCAGCARSIIQAGITGVIFGPGTYSTLAEEREFTMTMFKEARVVCTSSFVCSGDSRTCYLSH